MNPPSLSLFAALLLAAMLASENTHAAPGALDPTFNVTGKVTTAIGTGDDTGLNLAVQADGKIVMAGFASNGSNLDFALIRYNPNGSLDTSFGGTGKVLAAIGSGEDTAGAVALQSDGRIVVAGNSFNGSNQDIAVARFNTDGTPDMTFGVSGKVTLALGSGNDYSDAVVVQPSDQKIVVLTHAYVGSRIDLVLLRYTSAGVLDNTFGTNGKVTTNYGSQDIGHAMTVDANGKILVTGLSGPGNNAYVLELLRYTTAGALDNTFGTNGRVTATLRTGNNYGNGVAVQGDGKIVVTGLTGTEPNYDVALVRFTDTGALDTNFNGSGKVMTTIGNGNDSGNSVKLQSDGKIVVGGFSFNGSNNDFAVLRYNADGSPDTTFNGTGKLTTAVGPGEEVGASMALQADGKIVLGGYANNGSNFDFAVVRYLVDTPAVTTSAATLVTMGGATLNGSVNPNAASTTASFEYGLTTAYGSLVDVTPSPGSGDQPVIVSAGVTGLQPAQTYHFRLTATNAAGTANGADMTFTTTGVAPTATTGSATSVTTNSATISGTVNPNGAAVSAAVVEYGPTTSYGSTVNVTPSPGSGSSPVAVSAALAGLQPSQTYHYRLSATNAVGTGTGADATFATGAAAPSVTTGAPSNITGTSAAVAGTVNPNGAATTATFEFGLTTSYGSVALAAPNPGSGLSPVNVSATLAGLTPNRTYHYRLTGTNAGGFIAGADATFSTATILPTASTAAASDIATTSATLHGIVNPNGAVTTVRFSYGEAGALTQQTAVIAVGNGDSDVPVSATISGLEPFTDYEFRIAATNSAATAQGTVVGFTTLLTPLATLPDRAFATLGGAEFAIDVLANDAGDGLSIGELITSLPSSRVALSTDALTGGDVVSFKPVELIAVTDAKETFEYKAADLSGMSSAETSVSVFYFLGLQGTYFGNFSDIAQVRVLRLRLDLDFAGFASGLFEWEGERYPFKVQFDREGRARIAKARTGATRVTLITDLQLDPIAQTMSGTFRDTGPAPETINPVLQLLPADLDLVPPKGLEIAFIDPGSESAGAASLVRGGVETPSVEGIGFTQVRILGRAGRARFITKMPDFGAFSLGKPLEPTDGAKRPHYRLGIVSYRRAGSGQLGVVSGETFPGRGNTGRERVFGALSWQRLLPGGGSENLIALLDGFLYKPGGDGLPPGFDANMAPNATMRLRGGGLDGPLEFPVIMRGGKVVKSAADSAGSFSNLGMTVKITLNAGTFSGSFHLPGTQEKVKMIGGIAGGIGFQTVLGQQELGCRGSFFVPSTKRTGEVTIIPSIP